MAPKLWMISLAVLCSAVLFTTAVEWELKAPTSLQAYRHSCVIIPCTFQYETCTNPSTPERGMWLKNKVNVYHPNSSHIDSAFNGRTELLGDVGQKNCTLKIDNLRATDSGQYIFRVEGNTSQGGICHYTYSKHPVELQVHTNDTQPVISMEEAKVGSLATVTCSVKYICLSNPPDLIWSHEQRGNNSSVQNQDGDQWTLTSSLTFLTQDSDLDTVINCTAKYKSQSPLSYEEESISALLKLGYPPRIKQESACSKTQCVCVVESRPPSVITWILSDGQSTLKRTSTTEHEVEDKLNISELNAALVSCRAVNPHGNATVSFSLGGVLALYIVIPVFAVIIIILLASIIFLWRYRAQQTKKNDLSMVPNPLYKMTETQTQHPTKPKAHRRAAPPVPEMCTDKEDTEHTEDDNYVFPEGEGAQGNASRDLNGQAVFSRKSQRKKSKRQSAVMTPSYSYYIPEEMEDPPLKVTTPAKSSDDNIYIVPLEEGEEAQGNASRDSNDQAVLSRKSQSRKKSKRQSTAMTPSYSSQSQVPRVEEVDEGIYNNYNYDVYANY